MATVLVVDDEPLICKMLAQFLEHEGFAVLTATCASQAISLSRACIGQIDLLISDIVMPEMDGPSLATALKTINPDLAVLLMSGNCDATQLENPFLFLAKPFSMPELLKKVHHLTTHAKHSRWN
jgi:two-component system, cell cycle sensor histidine kinase and response regulator CckA